MSTINFYVGWIGILAGLLLGAGIGLESPTADALAGLELRTDWKGRQWPLYKEAVQCIQSHGIRVDGCFIWAWTAREFQPQIPAPPCGRRGMAKRSAGGRWGRRDLSHG